MLDPLKSHYTALLGVDESWLITNVSLDVAAKRVTIALEFICMDTIGIAATPSSGLPATFSSSQEEKGLRDGVRKHDDKYVTALFNGLVREVSLLPGIRPRRSKSIQCNNCAKCFGRGRRRVCASDC